MSKWLGSLLLLLPVLAGAWLADLGARLMFGFGLVGLVDFLGGVTASDVWVPVIGAWAIGFIILLTAGALYSNTWSNCLLLANEVVPHLFLGADIRHEDRYVRQDDPGGEVVTVWQESRIGRYPTTGFANIYRRHLLTRFPFGARRWQRLGELTMLNMLWPIVLAPLVFVFGQAMAWGPLVVAREHGLDLLPELASAGTVPPLPLVLFGELGRWVLVGLGVVTLLLLPPAIATGRWSRRVFERFEQAPETEIPRTIPLPEAVKPGAELDGRIVDSAGWRDTERKPARNYRAFLLQFEKPFEPPVFAGFAFRESRKRADFIEYLEERQAAGMAIKVRLAENGDLTLIPLDAAGGPPPDDIAGEILNRES